MCIPGKPLPFRMSPTFGHERTCTGCGTSDEDCGGGCATTCGSTGEICARCTSDVGDPVWWPCTSAIVLGRAPRPR